MTCFDLDIVPAGKPDRLRTEHLENINTPTIILQGERDTLGNRDEVAGYQLSKKIKFHWLPDGDHSFKPRKKSGRTLEDNWREGIEAVVEFTRRAEIA